MGVASAASAQTRKLMKLTLSLFGPRFNSSECKMAAKMAVAKIKLLKNKREAVIRQMRRDIALLLQSGQDATARIRVEHVIREQNVFAANEIIELFCELVVSRLPIISKERECPENLKEGIASLLFAAPRCSEIQELMSIKKIFEKKYGKDFVSAATDLRPNSGVNRMLIDKLSVRAPSGEVKLNVMKEIAKEYQTDWDKTESERELLKPPEELIEGPRTFESASSFPVKLPPIGSSEQNRLTAKSTNGREMDNMHFQDPASAAEAAAESARQAIAAAQAAAYLVNKDSNKASQASGFHQKVNVSGNEDAFGVPYEPQTSQGFMDQQSRSPGGINEAQNFDSSHYTSDEEMNPVQMHCRHVYRRHSYNETRPTRMDGQNVDRRHSYNPTSRQSDIIFDESDCDGEIEMEEPPATAHPPPKRSPPAVPSSNANLANVRVHPKLPDYDALAARFEALKYQKSQK